MESSVNSNAMSRVEQLEAEVEKLRVENERLRAGLFDSSAEGPHAQPQSPSERLTPDQVERYSRQLLLGDGFGVEGQLRLLNSSVLVVGAGGIGSTVLLYLAAAGIGKLSVADFDSIERSNLHRQIIHHDKSVGESKATSAARAVRSLNPTICCEALAVPLTHENALELVSRHTLVVDATDNPKTRYLINDACVLAGKPLVSGSAIGTEGQLSVYNHQHDNRRRGACYRCMYPRPNAAEGCKTCSDNGVLGPVPGLIGVLQSVEVLKVLTGIGSVMHNRVLMYDALRCSFFNIKRPPKSKTCPVCSEKATIKSMEDSCTATQIARGPSVFKTDASVRVSTTLPNDLNVSCAEYHRVRLGKEPHVLLDVRVTQQFDMCSLDGAINIPLARLEDEFDKIEDLSDGIKPIYCVCRRGIFSSEATRILSEAAATSRQRIKAVYNVEGGLQEWQLKIDPSLPKY